MNILRFVRTSLLSATLFPAFLVQASVTDVVAHKASLIEINISKSISCHNSLADSDCEVILDPMLANVGYVDIINNSDRVALNVQAFLPSDIITLSTCPQIAAHSTCTISFKAPLGATIRTKTRIYIQGSNTGRTSFLLTVKPS
ncbi:TPA: hypothetical protein I8Z14_000850 [Legionella pneumophila]|nr:Uncharacterised protein [Legionella pneumophila]HAT1820349.1 hypothetical protein [Legionella pneumophila]